MTKTVVYVLAGALSLLAVVGCGPIMVNGPLRPAVVNGPGGSATIDLAMVNAASTDAVASRSKGTIYDGRDTYVSTLVGYDPVAMCHVVRETILRDGSVVLMDRQRAFSCRTVVEESQQTLTITVPGHFDTGHRTGSRRR